MARIIGCATLLLVVVLWFAACAQAQQAVTPGDLEQRVRELEAQLGRLQSQRQPNGSTAPVEVTPTSAQNPPAGQQGVPLPPPPPPPPLPRLPDAVKPAEDQGYEVGSDVSFRSSWRDGFVAETANGDFRVHLGGRFQADAAWFKPDQALNEAFPEQWRDGADFRRLRVRADGTAYEIMDFVVEIEFSQGINGLATHPFPTDVFADFTHLPIIGNLAVGHYKEPFSLEDYGTPDSYGVFMERSSADSAFTPDRNLGVMMHNSYFEDQIALAMGVFRTSSDARSGNAFDYGDGEYAYTGRVAFIPYYENEGRCWLMFGPAFSHRILDPDDPGHSAANPTTPSRARFTGRAPIRVNSPALLDTSALVADSIDLFNLQLGLNLGPLLIQSEYYRTQVHNARRGAVAFGVPRMTNPAYEGFYVQASCFLTGDYHPLDRKWGRLARVRPNENWFFVRRGEKGNYDGFCHGWGAWEVAARYDYLDLSSPALDGFAGAPGVAGSAVAPVATAGFEHDITLSVSCFLNPNTRFQVNYIHAFRNVFDTTADGHVNALGMRLWWDF